MSLPRALCGTVCVSGVGETDYALDRERARAGEPLADAYGHAHTAFVRALADAGLERDQVDGLVVGPTLAYERTAEVLGLDVRWSAQADAAMGVVQGVAAIVTGQADCVALVYGNDQVRAGVQYGGPQAMGGASFLSYVYYAPWGLTSQGALYALLTRRYQECTGLEDGDLAHVAVGQRAFAATNPNAVMRAPLSVEDYLASRWIVEPLRLFDYTIVNDGGVALVLTARDVAEERDAGRAVPVRGVARADLNTGATSLRPRLVDLYRPAHRRAADALWEVAGCGPEDVDVLQVYDSFSIHVPLALTGFGFASEEGIGELLRSGATGPGGRLPVNTSGGHLSESYMQGWNHQVEAVRQARGEAGTRQVAGAGLTQYVSDVAGKVVSLLYEAPSAAAA